MPEFEHEFAVYYDADTGRRAKIRQPELASDQRFFQAKGLDLFDGSEQIRLCVRESRKGTRHFYATTEDRALRTVLHGESDPQHNQRIEELLAGLSRLETWSLTEKGRIRDGGAYKDTQRMPKYRWGSEIHRIVGAETVIRHDIFGQPEELNMSVTRPWIAIEVINTHYPEERAFQSFVDMSKKIPFIVLFDFSRFPNRFLGVEEVEGEGGRLCYRPWTYIIRNGLLWHEGGVVDNDKEPTADKFQCHAEKTLSRWK